MQPLSKTPKIEISKPDVMLILLNLPVKSLLRFRCVCKSWSSSLRTPQFIAQHHENNLQNNNGKLLVKLCDDTTSTPPRDQHFFALSNNYLVSENIKLPSFYETHFLDPVASCNGLLCLQDGEKTAIWNPSTREFKTLPKSTIKRPPGTDYCIFGDVGFGFDSTTNDYKVIRCVCNCVSTDDWCEPNDIQVELYSLGTDSWKELFVDDHLVDGTTVCNNGILYWQPLTLPLENPPIPIDGKLPEMLESIEYESLSFDLAREEFSVSKVKFYDKTPGSLLLELVEFNGSVGVFCYTEEYIDLWVMRGTWTKQFRIEIIPGINRPLGFSKNGDIFLESSSRELILFDHVTREFKNLGIHSFSRAMQLIAYDESLVPINGRAEQEEGLCRVAG